MNDENWFITGTSSGLGRLLTERLLERGARVVATTRQTDALRELQARHGERLIVSTLDVTDTAAVREVVDTAFERAPRIDVIDAMIAAAEAERPALRLALGGTAFESISSALTRRLAAIEAQRDVAYSADRERPDAAG